MWDGRDPERTSKVLIQTSGAEHTRRRRPWNRAFNSDALKGYEEIIEKRANQLIQTLDRQVGSTNLAQWISFFTFDFMSDMASVSPSLGICEPLTVLCDLDLVGALRCSVTATKKASGVHWTTQLPLRPQWGTHLGLGHTT